MKASLDSRASAWRKCSGSMGQQSPSDRQASLFLCRAAQKCLLSPRPDQAHHSRDTCDHVCTKTAWWGGAVKHFLALNLTSLRTNPPELVAPLSRVPAGGKSARIDGSTGHCSLHAVARCAASPALFPFAGQSQSDRPADHPKGPGHIQLTSSCAMAELAPLACPVSANLPYCMALRA